MKTLRSLLMLLVAVLVTATGVAPVYAVPDFTLTVVSPPEIIPNPIATTDFSFGVTLTNNGTQTEEVFGFNYVLEFSPTLPSGQFQWRGFSTNVPPSPFSGFSVDGAAVSNPTSFPVFVMSTAGVVISNATVSTPGNGTSIAPGETKTIATYNFRLAANAFRDLYTVTIQNLFNRRISYWNPSSNSVRSVTPSAVDGFIATPEPGSITVVLALGGLVGLRRRRETDARKKTKESM